MIKHGAVSTWLMKSASSGRTFALSSRRCLQPNLGFLALVGAWILTIPLPAQWVGCTGTTSSTCTTAGVNAGIGTTSAPFPLVVSTGTDRVLNFRGDPITFGFPPTLGGPIIEAVTSNQTALTPLTFAASGFSFMNGPVGIGTVSPAYALDVGGFIGQSCNSNGGYPTARVTGSAICTNFLSGQSAVDFWNTAAGYPGGFQFHQLTGTGAQSTSMTITGSGNVGIGTTSPQSTLAVNGIITSKEVVVTTSGWSDYVFAPDYQLRPLKEVAAYQILQKGKVSNA
jgi:hypothetical protein